MDNKKAKNLCNNASSWPDDCRINAIGQNGNDGTHYDTPRLTHTEKQISQLREALECISNCVMSDNDAIDYLFNFLREVDYKANKE